MLHTETLMWKEINETPEIFSKIRSANSDVMKKLVSAIKNGKASNFVAAARGTSDHAIIFFKYVLEVNTNYTVGLSAPSVVTLYHGKVNYSNSIVIGCSQSGQDEDVLEIIKKGNEQGAITIAVTNDENSPMAKEAKFHLFCSAGEKQAVSATKTFNAQLYLLLWLASELAENKNNLLLLKHLDQEITRVMPQIDQLTTEYAQKFKDMQSGFVLSRGLTYAIALEASLKLQETCYIMMKGYAGSDFLHGPMAMVNEQTPIIIYCAQNNGNEELRNLVRTDQIKIIKKMLSLNAPVLLVTNDVVLKGKFTRCNDALISFGVPEEVCMFAFAIFSQMFACKVSCLIGNNPDKPRGLQNVTITR
ncbi:MAG: SIS domain-containing protein [Clostridia bacterium]|nr:SIS domain-containing protein [Clostridia bacterium]